MSKPTISERLRITYDALSGHYPQGVVCLDAADRIDELEGKQVEWVKIIAETQAQLFAANQRVEELERQTEELERLLAEERDAVASIETYKRDGRYNITASELHDSIVERVAAHLRHMGDEGAAAYLERTQLAIPGLEGAICGTIEQVRAKPPRIAELERQTEELRLIDKLAADWLDLVTLSGPQNGVHCVTLNSPDTDGEDVYYHGPTRLDALRAAVAATEEDNA